MKQLSNEIFRALMKSQKLLFIRFFGMRKEIKTVAKEILLTYTIFYIYYMEN